MSDGDGLPTTDPDMVHSMQAEYDQAFRTGSEDQLNAARFRLVGLLGPVTLDTP